MIYPENILLLAPLSGFTDLPYREAAYRGGCRYAFTEMVDAASLAYASGNGIKLLCCNEFEHDNFIATQLVGSDIELIKRACEKLNEFDFSLLDFNLGCPVPKVVKKGAGAALGRNVEHALKCFETITQYSKFPLTAKIRILHQHDVEPTLELCRGLVELGAQALTVHGRTMEHFYTGEVNFAIIRQIRETFPQIPVIANGGVYSVEDCRIMRRETGCTRVMLAQGAMGNPWLFREIEGGQPPTLEEWKDMVSTHISAMVRLYGEESAMRRARKIVHDYLRGRGFPAALRNEASALNRESELDILLAHAFPAAEVTTRRIVISESGSTSSLPSRSN